MTNISWSVAEDNNKIIRAAVRAAQKVGLRNAGEHILNKSNAQAPIEDGDLIRSGAVSDISDDTVGISYDTPYAVRQHEDLSYRHDPGRNAKFLSNACKSESATAGKIVGTAIKRAMN
jgi:hypothetical protein